MFDESLVAIIFRILNFVALIGLFTFVFKKYFRNDIEQTIENDRLEKINLNTRISELEHRGSDLSEEIIKQEKLCAHLISRTDQWKAAFEKDIEQRRQEQQVLHIKATERAERQAATIVRERLIKAVLPKALDSAHNQLEESFEKSEHGKDFVRSILAHMKKSL